MNYDFVLELMSKYGDRIGYGMEYFISNDYDRNIDHDADEVLPWHDDSFKVYDYDISRSQKRESKFKRDDDYWGMVRYRSVYDMQSYNNNYSFASEAKEAIFESRRLFIKQALHGIDMKPNSLSYDEFGNGCVKAQGVNGESVSFVRATRGIGDTESLSIQVVGDGKQMNIVNSSSFYVQCHTFEGYSPVLEENLLSTCDASGFIFTGSGLFMFEKVNIEKDGYYSPAFEVSFYGNETLSFLKSMDADSAELVELQRMLNEKKFSHSLMKNMLETLGILPNDVTTIECSQYDVVTYANQVFSNPELFLARNKERGTITL